MQDDEQCFLLPYLLDTVSTAAEQCLKSLQTLYTESASVKRITARTNVCHILLYILDSVAP